MVGMSERNFYRFFCDVKQETPHAYLQKLRIAKSAMVLQTTDKSVLEVALECGYSDGSYFARQFRGIYGVTPRQFREDLRKPGAKKP
jgi:AraC-like DNA-binding protein